MSFKCYDDVEKNEDNVNVTGTRAGLPRDCRVMNKSNVNEWK